MTSDIIETRFCLPLLRNPFYFHTFLFGMMFVIDEILVCMCYALRDMLRECSPRLECPLKTDHFTMCLYVNVRELPSVKLMLKK